MEDLRSPQKPFYAIAAGKSQGLRHRQCLGTITNRGHLWENLIYISSSSLRARFSAVWFGRGVGKICHLRVLGSPISPLDYFLA